MMFQVLSYMRGGLPYEGKDISNIPIQFQTVYEASMAETVAYL